MKLLTQQGTRMFTQREAELIAEDNARHDSLQAQYSVLDPDFEMQCDEEAETQSLDQGKYYYTTTLHRVIHETSNA